MDLGNVKRKSCVENLVTQRKRVRYAPTYEDLDPLTGPVLHDLTANQPCST
jgi:hypothetical protein